MQVLQLLQELTMFSILQGPPAKLKTEPETLFIIEFSYFCLLVRMYTSRQKYIVTFRRVYLFARFASLLTQCYIAPASLHN